MKEKIHIYNLTEKKNRKFIKFKQKINIFLIKSIFKANIESEKSSISI